MGHNGSKHPDANSIAQERGVDFLREVLDSHAVPLADVLPQTSDKGKRIPLVPFNQIRLSKDPHYLVKGLIPRPGLVIAWGPPKCGKSFWAFDLAMHVALGRSYRGRRVRQGPVIYGAFEGQHGFEARVEAFRQTFMSQDVQNVPFYLEPMTIDLIRDHPNLIAAVRGTLFNAEPALVVLDTLNRSLVGSESSDEDMGAYLKAADTIRETFNCTVLIIHHCGVSCDRPRGHTSLTGSADAQIAVKRDAKDHIVAQLEYMKDGAAGETILSKLDVVEVGRDDEGDIIASCVVQPVEGSPTSSKSGPKSKGSRIALEALREALIEVGQPAPVSERIPSRVRVVTEEQWRDYAYRKGISPNGQERARQLAFQRAWESLVGDRYVGYSEPYLWIPE